MNPESPGPNPSEEEFIPALEDTAENQESLQRRQISVQDARDLLGGVEALDEGLGGSSYVMLQRGVKLSRRQNPESHQWEYFIETSGADSAEVLARLPRLRNRRTLS